MKNAERGMAPVQSAVFILHSTFCILHFHSWGEGELGRWTDAATQNCGGGFLTLKCWAKGQRQAGSLARQSQAGGLRYFGLAPVRFSTGLCPRSATRTHYRWGWPPLPAFPRVARGSQPWALGRNPFGIQVRISSGLDWRSGTVFIMGSITRPCARTQTDLRLAIGGAERWPAPSRKSKIKALTLGVLGEIDAFLHQRFADQYCIRPVDLQDRDCGPAHGGDPQELGCLPGKVLGPAVEARMKQANHLASGGVNRPKPENRRKSEARKPKTEGRNGTAARRAFGFRISFGFRASVFGFEERENLRTALAWISTERN